MRTIKIKSDSVFRRLMKKKRIEKFGNKTWDDYFDHLTRDVVLDPIIDAVIYRATAESLFPLWMDNFVENIEKGYLLGDGYILHDGGKKEPKTNIGQMPKRPENTAGLVIGAGPSIYINKHIELLVKKDWQGATFCTDRMVEPCLKRGLIPTYVVSVDGHRKLIPDFFNHKIVDKYGDQITHIVATTVAPQTIERARQAGMKQYFFHGLLDSFASRDSLTRVLNTMTGHTAVACGGNVGAASWTLAIYLHCKVIGLVGMDFGYRPDTPYEETAYYRTLLEKVGEEKQKMTFFFKREMNPCTKQEYLIDVVFDHYRSALRESVKRSLIMDIKTINCTEGGSIHGLGITCMPLSEFLEAYPK